jgi:PQQ-dependent dehydrogenase (methanol/ethanol family)
MISKLYLPIAILLNAILAFGQGAETAGSKSFAARCAGCHGADARGTDRGPALARSRRLQAYSLPQLRRFIQKGAPATGMPPFDLPDAELDALAALVFSMNAPAANEALPGDAKAGEQFFFGKGQCASCHMVQGRGAATGPDLSSVGARLTVDDIRESLLKPGSRAVAGYELVTVQLRNGRSLRGFIRGRSNFDLHLQDLQGGIHSVTNGQVERIESSGGSPMPPLKASPEESSNLVAYLARLTGIKPGTPGMRQTGQPGGIDFSRIVESRPGDWLTYDGNLSGNRYSKLTQINRSNVGGLVPKWIFSVPLWAQFLPDTPYYHENMKYFGLEVTPLVADGIMYLTGPQSVYAVDAVTGRPIWQYSRPRTPGIISDASLGTNRGAAILGDKIFRVTDNAHLIALNRTTGSLVWEVVMPDEPQRYGSTVAPLIVNDMVVAGVSGGDLGIRGFLAVYKAETGERAWRFWTVPRNGEPGSETWQGKDPEFGGGSTWLTGTYDPETRTLYWPTATPYPNTDDRDRPGDNLFTECVLALDPDTGKLKWHYQFTPHDVHVWDATEPPVLVNARYHGEDRKLLVQANRNGFFYVLDRTNGKVLLGKKFLEQVTWASGIGADGRPQLLPPGELVCPEDATNWGATAYSPVTRLFYFMALEKCTVHLLPGSWNKEHPVEKPGKKYLRALDIETGRVVWEIPQIGPTDGKKWAGVMATAGGVLFYGDPNGDFVAVDERDGKVLWHFPTNEIIKSSPMTYTVNGKQFVAIAAGPSIVSFGLP